MTDFDHAALIESILGGAASVSLGAAAPQLIAMSLKADQGQLTVNGALAVATGAFTGRAVADKLIVRDAATAASVWWDNANALAPQHFSALLADFREALAGRRLNVQSLSAGADPAHRLAVNVITDSPWHALFIRNLLIREPAPAGAPEVTILHVPEFAADPGRHGTRSATVIALDLARRLVLIGGTGYAGEIKKAVFSLFNFLAPEAGVLPMHCSANIGRGGDVALFFGLSGTGKTTLSSDPERPLIGDDEHGWSEGGVFNLEGGCYAKTIRLDPRAEPEIFSATQRFGTVLENVVVDAGTRRPDFDDAGLTENARAAYPLEALGAVHPGGMAPVPANVVFLTADAFGVLPPIARLSPAQAVYHFLSGYTAKVAGTERGVNEPQATFSACFGAPFMPRHPSIYGALLKRRLAESGARTWLINTGWVGGPYGVGRRIDIASTRRLVAAALSGRLDKASMRPDPVFGFDVPRAIEGVGVEILDPRRAWTDPAAYDAQAMRLRELFEGNFARLAGATGGAGLHELLETGLAAAE